MIDMLFITVPNCVQCAKARHVIEKVQPDFPELKVECSTSVAAGAR